MNRKESKRTRDSCRVANLVRDKLITAARDRLYRKATQYRDLNQSLSIFIKTSRLLNRACRLGYQCAAHRQFVKVNRLAGELNRDLEAHITQREPNPRIPSVTELAGELQQIDDEFGQWWYKADSHVLSVKTSSIVLGEVYLGPFSIELELNELPHFAGIQAGTGQHPFRVVALDPQPAAGNQHITHPHVSDERLCTGESAFMVSAALMEGRLADFFLIIRSLLQTYNPDSPYVPLDVWHGSACNECGERIHEDDLYYCENCGSDVCDGCTGRCTNCDDSACLGCLINCPQCEEYSCKQCMKKCAECGESCCVGCLEDELCPACFDAKENNRDQDESIEKETQITVEATAGEIVSRPVPAV